MNEITQAQEKVIKSWTEQRDSLLCEIGVLRTEKDNLNKEVSGKAISLTDINNNIAEVKGRLSELKEIEDRYKSSISIEMANLEIEKTKLQLIVSEKTEAVKNLEKQMLSITETLLRNKISEDLILKQEKIIEKAIGGFDDIHKTNLTELKTVMIDISRTYGQIIEKGEQHIEKTESLLSKLTKYLYMMSRPTIPKRPYLSKKGDIIRPEEKIIE
jgi:lipopolysaccharide biosynthesis regulator YciM